MRNKYRLIVKIDDFVVYDVIYTFTPETITKILKEAHDSSYRDIDTGCLEELIGKSLYPYEPAEENYSAEYPEFVVAATISERIYGSGMFGGWSDLDSLMSDYENVRIDKKVRLNESFSWECFPVD